MKFLREFYNNYRLFSHNEENQEDTRLVGDDEDQIDLLNDKSEQQSSDQVDLLGDENQESDLDQMDDQVDQESEQEMDQVADKATEDYNKQGVIRKVDGAHLVYKRQVEDGTYDELWMIRITSQDMSGAMKVKREIIAGTDIPPNSISSDDGKQSYSLWTIGNVQMLNIKGLSN